MNRLTRRHAVLGAALCCFLAAALVIGRGCEPDVHRADDQENSTADPPSFTISGDLRGLLSPGARVPLNLSFHNPNELDLTIDQITVTVTDVHAPLAGPDHPCGAADFAVQQLGPEVALGLNGGTSADLSGLGMPRSQWPAVGMLNRPVNQDGCKEALLTLSYEAQGSAVER